MLLSIALIVVVQVINESASFEIIVHSGLISIGGFGGGLSASIGIVERFRKLGDGESYIRNKKSIQTSYSA